MSRAYNISYLDDAQDALGAMLDYAVNACGEDLEQFYVRFIASGIAKCVSQANPKYMGMSGVEIALQAAQLTGKALPEKEPLIWVGSPEYWTGSTLAYISWYLNLDFGTLRQRGISAERICSLFNPFHEADISKTVDYIREILREHDARENPLKRQRILSGMTQQQLAHLSGIPLRVIRSYEQAQRSLGSASVQTVMRLCQVLSCRLEDIVP